MNPSHSELLPAVELEPSCGAESARHSVLWLHGLGADGHDFEPIVPELGIPDEAAVRFVFPHAPSQPVSINMGMVMPAWYDIVSVDLGRKHDEAGIERSALALRALIRRENERGVPSERIILAGFSQGGAIALHTGLRFEEPLLGIVALSTYLVCEERLAEERSAANAGVPIFQAHGTLDPMVVPERGVAARERLRALGYGVDWHEYPMQHQVCVEEIQELSKWFRARFEAAR